MATTIDSKLTALTVGAKLITDASGPSTKIMIITATAQNPDIANAHTVSIYMVDNGDTASAANKFSNTVILPGRTVNLGLGGQVITDSASFQATTDATSNVVVMTSWQVVTS